MWAAAHTAGEPTWEVVMLSTSEYQGWVEERVVVAGTDCCRTSFFGQLSHLLPRTPKSTTWALAH